MSSYANSLPLPKLVVQGVNASMRAVCVECEELPEKRRLQAKIGSGRFAKTSVYCIDCGEDYILGLVNQTRKARRVLTTGKGVIREQKKKGEDNA